MPIRFRCTACNQPVEVDDEAAGQSATCPYCRGLTPVPQFSTFTTAQAGPPVASPAPLPGEPLQPVHRVTIAAGEPSARYAALSWIALASAALGLLSYVGSVIVLAPIMSQVSTTASANEMVNELLPRLQANPALLVVSILSYLFMATAFFTGVAGAVLKARPLWPSVVALSATGLFAFCMCLGSVQLLLM